MGKNLGKKKMIAIIVALLVVVSAIVAIPKLLNSKTTNNSSEINAKNNGLAVNIQDGVTLDAFNWSYNTIKNNLADIATSGYSSVQTSPVQQPMEYDENLTDVEGQWEKLYHPVSLSIAENSWIGTASELKALCNEADKYGIKIVVTLKVDSLASNGSPDELSEEVKIYEPELYESKNEYFNSYLEYSENSIEEVVRGNSGQPDLNTSNEFVQKKVISLMKSCIDCGVDGFRFEGAKYIETYEDATFSSNFWENVITTASDYAKNKKGIDLYCYGEILNSPGKDRIYSGYTKFMSVIDNVSSDKITSGVANATIKSTVRSLFKNGIDANKVVLRPESYETFMENKGASMLENTAEVSVSNINKAWAIIASRKDAMGLYFVRPGETRMGEMGTTNWRDAAVIAANKFHNKYVGYEECISYSENLLINERYLENDNSDFGAIIVNNTGKSTKIVGLKVYRMIDGEYSDYITGAVFTVSKGTISGQMGDTGIAVLYKKADNVEKVTTTVETTTTIVMTTVEQTDGVEIFFDASNCSWFTDDDASPVLKADEGDFSKMNNFTDSETGKEMYYSKIAPDTEKITIARMLPTGATTNAYTFDYDKEHNLYTSKSDWTSGGIWSTYTGEIISETMNAPETVTESSEIISETTVTVVETGVDTEATTDETTQNYTEAPTETTNSQTETTTVVVETPTTAESTTVSTIKVYFSNNEYWENVYCYYWGGTSKKAEWPGRKMSFVRNNSYNQAIYCIELPSDLHGIVFNNGGKSQTIDIKEGIVSGIGYYIAGTEGDGKKTVKTYIYK